MKIEQKRPTKVRSDLRIGKGKESVSLDKLAQLVTKEKNYQEQDFDFNLVAGVDASNKNALRKRARRKYMTNAYNWALVKASKKSEKSTLLKSYLNTHYCAKELTLRSDGNVTGHYCKNRWCLVCNSIRTAQLINRYQPIFESWPEKYFVTLTVPNCSAGNLPVTLEEMYRAFAAVKNRIKVQHHRGQAEKLVGVRKMECTYNATRNDFHPHFHFIVNNRRAAHSLLRYWLEQWNKNSFDNLVRGMALRRAQDLRKANNKSVLELFKYFTKVVQKPNKDGQRLIYADAMDVVFNAVKGKRVFQNFGFKLPKLDPSELKEDEPKQDEVYAIMEYIWKDSDWVASVERVNTETGELYSSTDELTGYQPNEKLKAMADNVVMRSGHDWTPRTAQ